jgi:hypothetical protein
MFSSNMIYIGAAAVIALLVLVLVLRAVRARKRRALGPTEPASFEAAPDWASGPATWPADDEPPASVAGSAANDPPATAADPVGDEPSATTAKPVGHTGLAGYTGSFGYTGPADDAESTVLAQPKVVARPAVEAPSNTAHADAPPVAGSTPLLPTTPGATPPAVAMSEMDPAFVMVRSLLQNSGELNPAEFRRLELYRPERIVDAVDALTPRMTGRANESKRTRLQRIRQYAVSLMAQFESEETGFIPEGMAMPGAAPAEPAVISPLSPPEAAQVLPPEDWGGPIGGSELTLDPELSLLHDDLVPAPEAVDVAPAPEQGAEDLASMSPLELGRALGLSDDIEFKKAAIDALERLGTPEALSQLQHALENPDPDVQLHALSAAERLLGP